MSRRLFTDISELSTNSPEGQGLLGTISDAALVVADGRVEWIGKASDAPNVEEVISLAGRAVIPGFVDSHAHLVFAGDRAQEFAARMAGEKYAAGGIRSTVTATRAASDEELRLNLKRLADELAASGVTHFEVKTGYGLTVEDELRGLCIAKEFTDDVTLLAAHVVPVEYESRADEYVDLIINEMLPAAVGLAKWFDVFCEKGAFTVEQTRRLLAAAQALGFGLRLHANQLSDSGAAELALEFDCASADHCTYLSDAMVQEFAASESVVTLLPGAEFSTRSTYPNARRLIDAGVKVAIATDCNPGSSYTTSMPFVIAVAVRDLGMKPEEAVYAATWGGAQALKRTDIGHLGVGARADFVVLAAPSQIHLAYRPGVQLVESTWRAGERIFHNTGRHSD